MNDRVCPPASASAARSSTSASPRRPFRAVVFAALSFGIVSSPLAAGAPAAFCRIARLVADPAEFADRTAAKAFYVVLSACGSPARAIDVEILYQADRSRPTRVIAKRQNVRSNVRDGQDGSIFGEVVPAGQAFIRVNPSGFVLVPGCYTAQVAFARGDVGELTTCTTPIRFQLDSRRDRDHRDD